MTKSKSRGRMFFRFGLRTFLVVVTLIAIGFGWFVQSIRNQQHAFEVLQGIGLRLDNDSDDPFLTPRQDDDADSGTYSQRIWQSFCQTLGAKPDLDSRLASLTDVYLPEHSIDAPDFQLFRYLTNLKTLTLGEIKGDLYPLRGLSNLTHVEIIKSSVDDLSPLRKSSNLTELRLPSSQVHDLAPVGNLHKLTAVNFRKTKVADISVFRKLPNLDDIVLAKTNVRDISPLADLKFLKIVNLSDSKVADISPLAGHEVLLLNLSGLNIDDFTCLNGTSFASLDLHRTNFSSFKIFERKVTARDLFVGGPALMQLDGIEALCARWIRDQEQAKRRARSNRHNGQNQKLGGVIPVVVQDSPLQTGGGFDGANSNQDSKQNGPGITEQDFEPLIQLIQETINEDAFSDSSGIQPFVVNFGGIRMATRSDSVRIESVNRGMERLEIADSPIQTLEPIRKLKQLRRFRLSKANVSDLSPIFELRKLVEVDISDCPIENLNGLGSLVFADIVEFQLVNTLVKNAEPIVNLRRGLRELNLSGSPVQDISWIYRLRRLVELELSGTAISELGSVSELPTLLFLDVSRTQISDIDTLKEFEYLRHLNLAGTNVQDVSALANMRIDQLILSNTGVSDLAPIFGPGSADAPFDRAYCGGLAIDGCPIQDLSAIKKPTQLEWLNMSKTDISELSPLRGSKSLRELDISFSQVQDLSPIQDLNLDLLMMESVEVSKEQIAKFRLANPKCKIEFVQKPLAGQTYTPLFMGGPF